MEKKDGAAASEYIRARRKHAKQLKKLEKKTKKEEEFLRDLRKPKDTKVVLADRSFLEKLAKGRDGRPSSRPFDLSNSDFPALSSRKPERKPTPPEKRSTTEAATTTTAPDSTGVVVNLGDLIVAKQPKKRKQKQPTKIRRTVDSNALCGNMLDSSNPKRSRGKRREMEKKTFTKLKLAIIRDRILKMRGEENSEMDREKFRMELDMYLSDLMKKLKVAKEERAARAVKTAEVVPEGESAEPAKKGKGRKVTKYRKYCDNAHTEDLDEAVNALVQGIVYLQDRAFGRNPIKAKAKPRHMVGLREVKKCLTLHKVKMLILAPDLEAQETVFNTIEELKKSAEAQNVPCVFALSRRQLGYSTKKSVPVSAFGVLSYDGLEDKFAAVKDKLKEAQEKMKKASTEESNIPETIPKAMNSDT